MYKLANNGFIVRISDSAIIPTDEGNVDYIAFQQWLYEGNVPAQCETNTVSDEVLNAQRQLAELDKFMPRSVENIYDAIGWDKAPLWDIERKNKKDELRSIINGSV